MKILVLNFQGVQPDLLFSDERLENLRRFMDMGCFGELKGEPSEAPNWMLVARQENHILTLQEFLQQAEKRCVSVEQDLSGEDLLKTSQESFAALRKALEAGEWDYCQLVDRGLEKARTSSQTESWSADYYLHLDREFLGVLEQLDDDTAIAIVSDPGAHVPGSFVLVSSNNPISGEHEDGSAVDIAPTLLELAGYPLPSETAGKSWVSGMELNDSSDGLSAEEEEILRERLSGLGYI